MSSAAGRDSGEGNPADAELDLSNIDLSVGRRKLRADKNVTSLTLSNCGIRNDSCAELGLQLALFPSLRSVNLSENLIGFKGLSQLFEAFPGIATLVSLDLSHNFLDEAGFVLLANMIAQPDCQWEFLSLGGNASLSASDGVLRFAKALAKNHRLKILNLFECNLRDSAVIELAEALKINRTLMTLDLSVNILLGPKCLEHFAAAAECNSTLTGVHLVVDTEVSDGKVFDIDSLNMKIFEELIRNSKLEYARSFPKINRYTQMKVAEDETFQEKRRSVNELMAVYHGDPSEMKRVQRGHQSVRQLAPEQFEKLVKFLLSELFITFDPYTILSSKEVEGAEKEVKVEAEGMVEPIILPNKIAFRCGLFLDLIETFGVGEIVHLGKLQFEEMALRKSFALLNAVEAFLQAFRAKSSSQSAGFSEKIISLQFGEFLENDKTILSFGLRFEELLNIAAVSAYLQCEVLESTALRLLSSLLLK